MIKNRTIKSIIHASLIDMGGLVVRQAFPSGKMEHIDPFLLLHHGNIEVPKDKSASDSGVGPHPHRGFSPVTFLFKGGINHQDSRGHNHTVYEGGVQWMNAGMGIIHSERMPANIQDLGGKVELIQLWVNTPAKHKMDQPIYMPVSKEEIPFIETEDKLARVNIISGELEGINGVVPTLSPVNTFTALIKKGGTFQFNVPDTHNAFIYLLNGRIMVGEEEIIEKYLTILNNDGESFLISAMEESSIMIGTGEPLNETIASLGPFVMNTQTEIMEAFRDYQMGKMGVLIENS